MSLDELLAALSASCWERLKWRVCRSLGVMPGVGGEGPSDGQVLLCAAHMVLDRREQRKTPGSENPGFDMERFRALKEGERHGGSGDTGTEPDGTGA